MVVSCLVNNNITCSLLDNITHPPRQIIQGDSYSTYLVSCLIFLPILSDKINTKIINNNFVIHKEDLSIELFVTVFSLNIFAALIIIIAAFNLSLLAKH